ncbi:MAG: biopolymer transporter ExbD [Candidatus Polarisedimenticolaceae bacterium]|nr:biopolymer transporter ExbD [Candidatus Polarisedimenticolaceae bacterium]
MRRPRRRHEETELDITAFMNLMVILVPFLLMTAAFSQLAILQLNLPQSGAAADADNKQKKKEFVLEVIIRKDALEVADRNGGLIKRIENGKEGYETLKLSKLLQQIKARFPDKLDAFILSEPDTHYESIIQIMDTVRQFDNVQAGSVIPTELFPIISIGDAPPLPDSAKGKKGGKS